MVKLIQLPRQYVSEYPWIFVILLVFVIFVILVIFVISRQLLIYLKHFLKKLEIFLHDIEIHNIEMGVPLRSNKAGKNRETLMDFTLNIYILGEILVLQKTY